jgi:hypothetical protein
MIIAIQTITAYEIGFNASEVDAAHAIQEPAAIYNLIQAYLASL